MAVAHLSGDPRTASGAQPVVRGPMSTAALERLVDTVGKRMHPELTAARRPCLRWAGSPSGRLESLRCPPCNPRHVLPDGPVRIARLPEDAGGDPRTASGAQHTDDPHRPDDAQRRVSDSRGPSGGRLGQPHLHRKGDRQARSDASRRGRRHRARHAGSGTWQQRGGQAPPSALTELLEVPAPTLRSWERRYGVPLAGRSSGGHRRYARVQLDQLRRMRDLIARGRRPVEAAASSTCCCRGDCRIKGLARERSASRQPHFIRLPVTPGSERADPPQSQRLLGLEALWADALDRHEDC